jgi:hypothetical protein
MQTRKKPKPQADRLLKRLPLKERHAQEKLRKLILNDPQFKSS